MESLVILISGLSEHTSVILACIWISGILCFLLDFTFPTNIYYYVFLWPIFYPIQCFRLCQFFQLFNVLTIYYTLSKVYKHYKNIWTKLITQRTVAHQVRCH